MSLAAIILPVFVLVSLAFILLGLTGRARTAALRNRELAIKDIALGQDRWPETPAKLGRAFENQFELPVLFYILGALALITHMADQLFVIFEWLFVGARIAHAVVHATINRVPLRFALFVAGLCILMLMWATFAFRILVNF